MITASGFILNHSSTFGIFSQSYGNSRQIDIAESDSTSLARVSHRRSNLFYSPEKTADAELDGWRGRVAAAARRHNMPPT